jgi:hypothetical protein
MFHKKLYFDTPSQNMDSSIIGNSFLARLKYSGHGGWRTELTKLMQDELAWNGNDFWQWGAIFILRGVTGQDIVENLKME